MPRLSLPIAAALLSLGILWPGRSEATRAVVHLEPDDACERADASFGIVLEDVRSEEECSLQAMLRSGTVPERAPQCEGAACRSQETPLFPPARSIERYERIVGSAPPPPPVLAVSAAFLSESNDPRDGFARRIERPPRR